MEENSDSPQQSSDPQLLRCLALYREGSLLEARAELKEPGCDRDDEGYRRLRTQVAISPGNRNELSSIVAEEFSKKKVSAQEKQNSATTHRWSRRKGE